MNTIILQRLQATAQATARGFERFSQGVLPSLRTELADLQHRVQSVTGMRDANQTLASAVSELSEGLQRLASDVCSLQQQVGMTRADRGKTKKHPQISMITMPGLFSSASCRCLIGCCADTVSASEWR